MSVKETSDPGDRETDPELVLQVNIYNRVTLELCCTGKSFSMTESDVQCVCVCAHVDAHVCI